MRICPITYEPIEDKKARYTKKGLHRLSPSLDRLLDLPFSAEEQRREAEAHAAKLSIQGVQPKLSSVLNIKEGKFEFVDKGGRFILKPQVERFKQLPENEDLTMRLAEVVGIEVPTHGLVYSKDGSMTYFIRRFDRRGQKDKIHIEDFAQLSEESRDTKYSSSMEKVADILNFCTFPAVERLKLFKRLLLSFLIGNEDMHLKNFSLIVREEKTELSPAYDLVNSTLVLAAPKEELALPIRGKKRRISRADLYDYYALERLQINKAAADRVFEEFQAAMPEWIRLIAISFLSKDLKTRYRKLLVERAERVGIAVSI